jgi:2-phosphosulfolactate phosphatase
MKFKYVLLEDCATATGTVIVIDVIRAFTTAAYAFQRGAESINLVGTVDQALSLKEKIPGVLVMGEVNGLPPKGFDFGNSPTQILEKDLRGKHLIQRTSTGTQGVVRSINAGAMLTASFVVARATVHYIFGLYAEHVTFVITGTQQNDEDLACAEYLEALFRKQHPDPAPFIKRVMDSKDASLHLDPQKPEFPESDLDYCTRVDACNFAMTVSRQQDRLVMRAVPMRSSQKSGDF